MQVLVPLYRAWPGKNIPLCRGRFLLGPDWVTFLLTWVMIITPTCLFIVKGSNSVWISCIVGISCFASIYSLLRTAFTEPGIIPRGDARNEHLWKTESAPEVDGVKLKYCVTCRIWKPIRSKHCRYCDHCIDKFDHHCPWVSNCVGKRNYRYFVMFVISTAVHAIVVFAGALYTIIEASEQPLNDYSGSEKGLIRAISENAFASGILVYTFLIGCCLGSFSCYHLQLIFSDTTTNEQIKGYMDGRGSTSGFTNCYNLFCRPVPPSLIDLQTPVDPEMFSQSQQSTTVNSEKALVSEHDNSDRDEIV